MSEKFGLNIKAAVKIALYVLVFALGIFIVFKASIYMAPFIIAFAISSMMEPLIRILMKKVRLSRKISAVITLFFVLSTLGILLVLLVSKLISEMSSIYNMLPLYYSRFYDNTSSLLGKLTDIYDGLPIEVTKNIEGIVSNLSSSLMVFVNSFIKGVLSTAISIPEAIVFTLVTIMSTYFMASDRDRISNYFKTQLPQAWFDRIRSIKTDMFSALFGYIRAQLILMTITFTELSIGFWIIGIDYFIFFGFIISIIDALPILGTGGVLIPWSIYEFLTGDIRVGTSLLILYVIVLVVRQMVEPKVLSYQIGMHPLVTLLSMYGGLQILGVAGLIIGPVSMLLLKNILSGILKKTPLKDYLHSRIFYPKKES